MRVIKSDLCGKSFFESKSENEDKEEEEECVGLQKLLKYDGQITWTRECTGRTFETQEGRNSYMGKHMKSQRSEQDVCERLQWQER